MKLSQSPQGRPGSTRKLLLEALAATGLVTACGPAPYAQKPELALVATYEDPCGCMPGTEVSIRGKNAEQKMETQPGYIDDEGVLEIERGDLLVDQEVTLVHGETQCDNVRITNNVGAPVPDTLKLEKGVNTYEWFVESSDGQCEGGTDSESGGTGEEIPCDNTLECYEKCAGACIKGSCDFVPPVYLPGAAEGYTTEGEGHRAGSNSEERYGENGVNLGQTVGYQVVENGKLVNRIAPDYVQADSNVYDVKVPTAPNACFEHDDKINYSEYMPCDDEVIAALTEEHVGEVWIDNKCFYSEPQRLRLVIDPNPVN